MSDIYVTLSGNVAADPRQYQFPDGSRATTLRLAVNRRVLDRQTQTWTTEDTTYYMVRCYRALADNVAQSVRKGHPLVVYGRLRIKQFEDRQGEQRFWAEIEATSVGHDLKWGIATFEKPARSFAAMPSAAERRGMEETTREWELRAVQHLSEQAPHADEAGSRSGEEAPRPDDAAAHAEDRSPSGEKALGDMAPGDMAPGSGEYAPWPVETVSETLAA